MNEQSQDTTQKPFPFNNLYLISGLVTGINKWWAYLFTVIFLMTGYFLFQSAIFVPLMNVLMNNGYSSQEILSKPNLLFDSKALQMDKNLVLLLELGMFVLAAGGFYIGLRYVHQKTLTSVLTGYEKFRYKRFWFAFSVWASLLVLSTLLSYIFYPEELTLNFNLGGFLISAIIMFTLMPIQTGLEEVVFRGYFMQGLSQLFKNGIVPLFITSLLFGLAHMSNPEVDKFGVPIMLTYYVFFALFMGALTLLDEGIELAFGIHFANNFISSLLLSSENSVIKTYSIFEVQEENPSSEIVLWLVMAAITFFIFQKKYAWKNFKLIVK